MKTSNKVDLFVASEPCDDSCEPCEDYRLLSVASDLLLGSSVSWTPTPVLLCYKEANKLL